MQEKLKWFFRLRNFSSSLFWDCITDYKWLKIIFFARHNLRQRTAKYWTRMLQDSRLLFACTVTCSLESARQAVKVRSSGSLLRRHSTFRFRYYIFDASK
jgi:hypothetical protein